MNSVLHWSDAVAYFGEDIQIHAEALSRATQATYGLLTCRSAEQGTSQMVNRDGDHAERRLMLTPLWTRDLTAALSDWYPGDDPMVILLAINRSPCADCAHVLASALHALNDRYALRCEKQYFILASLGLYQGRGFMADEAAPHSLRRPSRTVTTTRGLEILREAGWKLCVLDFGRGLTRRGTELLEYLQYSSRSNG